jgi:hypothetical protein
MAALRDENFSKAYDLCSDSLQSSFGSTEELKTYVEVNDLRPKEWDLSYSMIADKEIQLKGNVLFQDGRTATVAVWLIKVNALKWKVDDFFLTDTDEQSGSRFLARGRPSLCPVTSDVGRDPFGRAR